MTDPQRPQSNAKVRAATSVSCISSTVAGSSGLYKIAIRALLENVSFSNSRRFAAKSVDMYEKPVMLPPGRARFGPHHFQRDRH